MNKDKVMINLIQFGILLFAAFACRMAAVNFAEGHYMYFGIHVVTAFYVLFAYVKNDMQQKVAEVINLITDKLIKGLDQKMDCECHNPSNYDCCCDDDCDLCEEDETTAKAEYEACTQENCEMCDEYEAVHEDELVETTESKSEEAKVVPPPITSKE